MDFLRFLQAARESRARACPPPRESAKNRGRSGVAAPAPYANVSALRRADADNSRSALAIVLAAGEGTRMKSDRPKVAARGRRALHARPCAVERRGGGRRPRRRDRRRRPRRRRRGSAPLYRPRRRSSCRAKRLGTAHAVLAARDAIAAGMRRSPGALRRHAAGDGADDRALCAPPLREGAAVAVLAFEASDPFGYGRLLRDAAGRLVAIREEKDASDDERAVTALQRRADGDRRRRRRCACWTKIDNNNAKGEFYLTDVVELARARRTARRASCSPTKTEVLGVNDRIQLAQAEAVAQDASAPRRHGRAARR